MLLVNRFLGSILVVGGEEGSNGAPVPSIEVSKTISWTAVVADSGLLKILPTPAGGPTFVSSRFRRKTPLNTVAAYNGLAPANRSQQSLSIPVCASRWWNFCGLL